MPIWLESSPEAQIWGENCLKKSHEGYCTCSLGQDLAERRASLNRIPLGDPQWNS